MSDQPEQPKSLAPSEAKPGREPLPKQQTLSMSQHIFVWGLVIVVGVLFGMGGTVGLLKSPPKVYGNVSENEILVRMNLAQRLEDIIRPSPYSDEFMPGIDRFGRSVDRNQWFAEKIQLAHIAESQGLLPGGDALKAIVKDFLNKPLPGSPGKRYLDAIEEHRSGDKAVTEAELSHFLAERAAVELLFARNVVAPAMPQALADNVNEYLEDKVEVDELTLDAKHLLPKIADDDAEIQVTYEKLRNTRFARPAACVVTIAYADTKALAAQAAVTDAELQQYYDAHKDQYKKPAPPAEPAKPAADAAKPAADAAKPDAAKPAAAKPEEAKKAEPEYKPLAEVAEEIRGVLKQQKAEKKAKELVDAFSAGAEDLEGQKDNAGFKQAAVKAGLAVKEGVAIDAPASGGELAVPELGDLSETQLHLFAQEPNFVSTAIQSTGAKPAWVVLRLDSKRDAGFRELKEPEVRAQVIAALAGQRAYKDLLKEAETARAAAEQLGPGGLKKYAESEAAKVWAAKVATQTLSANTELRAPPAEVGGVPGGDAKMLASLALPSAPVLLAEAESGGEELPKVKLVQATGFKPAAPLAADKRVDQANLLRRVLARYRQNLFSNGELRSQLNSK
jgi:hypothetical protein